MHKFWKFLLRRNLISDFLSGVYTAVLSLDDSSFPKFNWVGKRLCIQLGQLESKEIIPIGLCDGLKKLLDLFQLPIDTRIQEVRQFKWKFSVVDERPETQEVFERIPNVFLLGVRSWKIILKIFDRLD